MTKRVRIKKPTDSEKEFLSKELSEKFDGKPGYNKEIFQQMFDSLDYTEFEEYVNILKELDPTALAGSLVGSLMQLEPDKETRREIVFALVNMNSKYWKT